MRFCMVTTFYPPYNFGGCGIYVRALSRALVAQGHEVEVMHCVDAYRTKYKDAMPDEAPEEGIVVHRLKSRFGFLSPLITQQTGHPGLKAGTARAVLARPFDVVHFHNISLVGGPAIVPWSRAPVTLYTPHEHWLLCPTHVFWKNKSRPCDRPTCFSCSIVSGIPPQLWRYTRLVERSMASVDAMLAPSEFTAQQHRDAGLKPPVHVLPLFSTLEPNSAVAARSKRPRFLFVGRLTASKGVVELLEDFAELPGYDLDVIGEGELGGALRGRFANYPHIRFLGRIPQRELIQEYQSATALIFPSLAPETFGLAIVEAFACGTPAIVRDAGGCREPIEATGGGLIYQTSKELRSALSRLAHKPGVREGLAKRAREGFLRLYTMQRHLDSYLGLVNDIVSQKIQLKQSCAQS
jgi:glycosyltransferase involved in cell wall biosynthesis